MRIRRSAAVLALTVLAGVGLVGCRTSPSVAAYVGDETITVDELQGAVAERRADPEVTAGEDPAYTRTVLDQLVRRAVFDSAAEHFGVSPDPGGLTELLEDLLRGQGTPEDYFAQQAAQGVNRSDALERVRQIRLLADIAVAEGAVDESTEATLRAAYDQALTQRPPEVSVGYVNVPDQATADGVVAALQADPGRYAEVAAPYLELATLPAPQPIAIAELPTQLPAELAARVAESAPGSVFATPVEGLDGLLVVLVEASPAPAFEEVRPQLEAQALSQAADAGAGLLAEYEADLDIDVNPRFGSLAEGSVVASDGGVVRLLDAEG
ncbi:peptidylprolyl isomerase [Trujillonella endophytica]|uniref:Peptidyl-prolyl cis-trans isomerase SurA n=1 Tax=Trujillonella endophytica TaxID=673521 RepID=A0A1H8SKK1_9ACTN|nr:peptidylprolyl isomerase [Trujillella endophytica]SEO79095.1 peptidyl-prolyl cis-trans isomerase SurA [Trujillella endophytica]